jgi:ubiquitin-conjugating enzyme E2 A
MGVMSTIATRRLLRDLKVLEGEQKSDFYLATPSEDNLFHWRGFIYPKEDSIYFGTTLPFKMDFTGEYPHKPPRVIFPSGMLFHPNIYDDGSICVDILQDKWTAQFDVRAIILSLILLLNEPNPNSPANKQAAALFLNDRRKFEETVRHTISKSWRHVEW